MSSLFRQIRPRKRLSEDSQIQTAKRTKSKMNYIKEQLMIQEELDLCAMSTLDGWKSSLNCKENVPPTVLLRSHASESLKTPPPLFQYQNGLPLYSNVAAAKKQLISSPLNHVHPVSMLLHKPHTSSSLSISSSSPLPSLTWTDSTALWQQMRQKDTCVPAPEAELRTRHPSILPSMRTILLDWMLEVCEEYRIHRETFYLSVDLLDRFMDIQSGVLKEQLQLIGVTCLFIASKIEEIYPPKLADFAYVTDGACLADDIVYTELLICKALNWKLHHYTVSVNTWINIYMQLASSYFRPPGIKAKEFEYPAFSPYEFIRVMQVLDLCTLDISSRQFSSSVLAATALYLVSEKCHLHLNLITGFQLTDIHLCLQWLQPFVTITNRTKPPVQKVFKGVILQDAHNIQTHEVTMSMLEEAADLHKYQETHMLRSPDPVLMECSALMTPPRQERRFLSPLNSTIV